MMAVFDPVRAVVGLGAMGAAWLLTARWREPSDRRARERARLIRLLIAVSCAQIASEVYEWAMDGAKGSTLVSMVGSAVLVCGFCSLVAWGGYEVCRIRRRRDP